MFALDTNVLVRLLVDDPGEPAQCQAARAFVAAQKDVLVAETVLLETVWVLQSLYGVRRAALKALLGELRLNARYKLERPAIAAAAIDMFDGTALDFGDCMVKAASDAAAAELVTFDKRLSREPRARLLSVKGIA